MAGNNIDVEAKDRMLTIQVRNMIRKDTKAKDVLEIQPLLFKLEVPLVLAGNGNDEKLKKEALAKLERGVKEIVVRAQDLINEEVNRLGQEIGKQREKDERGDTSAYQNAVKQTRNTVERLDDIVDGLSPSVREETKKLIKAYGAVFPKQRLTSVGTWGFHGDKGIRVRPGTFKNVTKDEEDDKELAKALDAARYNKHEFVFVNEGEGGLVLRKRIAGMDTRLAKEQSDGGRPLYGTVKADGGIYHFELDKECSDKPEKLAQRIRAIVKERCKKSITVKVSDDDQDIDDEPAAKAGAAAQAKKP